MKHLVAYVCAVFAIGIATAALYFGRAELAHSIPLLCFVGGFYLLAFLLAAPAQMKDARTAMLAAWTAYKNPSQPGGTPQ